MIFKKYSMAFLALIAFSCTDDVANPSDGANPSNDPNRYSYNPATGKCTNFRGEEGYNPLILEQVYSTRNCECMDLSNRELVYLLDSSKIDPWFPLGYNVLDSFNFRGAKLDSARLFFNHIEHADFRGADMRTLQYGYARLYGRIDQFTKLPVAPNDQCKTANDSLDCLK